jgi:hypothetical protein
MKMLALATSGDFSIVWRKDHTVPIDPWSRFSATIDITKGELQS